MKRLILLTILIIFFLNPLSFGKYSYNRKFTALENNFYYYLRNNKYIAAMNTVKKIKSILPYVRHKYPQEYSKRGFDMYLKATRYWIKTKKNYNNIIQHKISVIFITKNENEKNLINSCQPFIREG